jgi:hypothetical protein
MYPFRTCKYPLAGAKAFVGTVVFVERTPCSQMLSVRVQRADEVGLPAMVQVDFGACKYWAGKTGDVIDLAIFETRTAGGDVYPLACWLRW